MSSKAEKTSHVTYDGRTIVDVNALLRKPEVQERIAKVARKFREADERRRAEETRTDS
jgi:hypothetical protein